MPLFNVAGTPTVVPDAFLLLEIVRNVVVVFEGTEQIFANKRPEFAARTRVEVFVVNATLPFVVLLRTFESSLTPNVLVFGVKAIIPRRRTARTDNVM